MLGLASLLSVFGAAVAVPPAWLPGSEPSPKMTPHDYYPHIIGGQEVSPPGKYEFLVALLSSSSGMAYDNQFCGASLVADKWVLTAAHCCEGAGRSVYALVGGHDLKTTQGQKIAVKTIIPHPEYSKFTLDADVCLLELTTAVSGYDFAILDDGTYNQVGQQATVAGWGNTKSSGMGSYPNKAQEVAVPIVSDADCNARSSYDGAITENMFCAGYKAGGKDSCQGDSGGPLFVEGKYQVGVVSWGEGCALPEKYGVYAHVANLRSWINSYINRED